ncbi:hypothetical protein POM88_001332 [Heracleum sosnowskyi]|uniref:Kinesin motor domain-containing protein n=1 Tax=Heracleum sosnowskyi TaxID=360622 RepID=A0AAD8JFW1_9APIA|nr:hypothetical protein POM88_001332 [Heracleum sosnowskyi]
MQFIVPSVFSLYINAVLCNNQHFHKQTKYLDLISAPRSRQAAERHTPCVEYLNLVCLIYLINDYICEHDEREFVLKFSAMEIYNESVRDLLGLDSTPLRLLDDPERGTVVDKLTEVTLRDWSHLKQLLAILIFVLPSLSSGVIMATLSTIGGIASAMGPGIEKASKVGTGSAISLDKLNSLTSFFSQLIIRGLGSVGEPINPAWRWFYHVIGALRCPISDTWCQTETGSFMITSLSVLPATASWGMRASNRQQSPTSVTSSNGPSKQKSDACGISVAYLTATTSLSKVSVLHSDSGKKLNGEIRLTAQMNKSEPVASVELYSDADQQRKPSNTSAMIGHSINQVISSQISHNPILQQKKHPPVRILLLQEIGLNSD